MTDSIPALPVAVLVSIGYTVYAIVRELRTMRRALRLPGRADGLSAPQPAAGVMTPERRRAWHESVSSNIQTEARRLACRGAAG